MSGWRRWLRLSGILCGMLALYFVVPVHLRMDPRNGARIIGGVAILVLLAVVVVRQLRVHIDHFDRRMDGLLITIVAVVVCFAFGFYVLSLRDPSQVVGLSTRLDALYFTMTTLTTVGYGDIHAAGQAARAMVVAQMLFNAVFVAAAAGLLSARMRASMTSRALTHATEPPD